VNHAAHLSYWKIRGSYESLGDCDHARGAMLIFTAANPPTLPEVFIDLSPSVMSEVTKSLVCISSDDPRLKGC